MHSIWINTCIRECPCEVGVGSEGIYPESNFGIKICLIGRASSQNVSNVFFKLTAPQVKRKWCTVFKCIFALSSMYRSQAIEIWMMRLLSAVGKHYGYMLNTGFTQVLKLCTLNLCSLYFLPSALFSFHLGVMYKWKVVVSCNGSAIKEDSGEKTT